VNGVGRGFGSGDARDETSGRVRAIWIAGCVLAIAAWSGNPGCRDADAPVAGAPVAPSVPPGEDDAGGRDPLDLAGLAQRDGGVRVTADATVALDHAGRALMLRDERRLDRTGAGDFVLSIRRVHAGSESGDTDERIEAVRVGAGYWTRGSAGPWVSWDDAVDEPAAAADAALSSTRDLLALVRQCGRFEGEGEARTVALRTPDCPARSAPDGAGWSGRVRSMQGRTTWSGDLLVAADLTVRIQLASGAGAGEATIEHAYRTEALPAGEAPRPPDASRTVPSRRERPVRMVRTVLEGWEDALGPGAPAGVRPRR